MCVCVMNRYKTKWNAEMEIFNIEYTPELEWIMIEPTAKANDENGEKIIKSPSKSLNNIPSYDSDLHQHNNIIDDFQSILHLIKLIKKMIKYNSIYYERVEKRRQRQNLELQGLTVLLQNICNDLKNV